MEKLLKTGQLTYPDPVPPKDPLPDSYRADQYCNFHRDAGHRTDRCLCLRHAIQDFIDQGVIPAPPPLKPNTQTNAMPHHAADAKTNQISLILSQSNSNPSAINPIDYIVPVSQPKPIVLICEEDEVSIINVRKSIDEDKYYWDDLVRRFEGIEFRGFPNPQLEVLEGNENEPAVGEGEEIRSWKSMKRK